MTRQAEQQIIGRGAQREGKGEASGGMDEGGKRRRGKSREGRSGQRNTTALPGQPRGMDEKGQHMARGRELEGAGLAGSGRRPKEQEAR
jgi:hypothetical protein